MKSKALISIFASAFSASAFALKSEAHIVSVGPAGARADQIVVSLSGEDLREISQSFALSDGINADDKARLSCGEERNWDGDSTGEYVCSFVVRADGSIRSHIEGGYLSKEAVNEAYADMGRNPDGSVYIVITGAVATAIQKFDPAPSLIRSGTLEGKKLDLVFLKMGKGGVLLAH